MSDVGLRICRMVFIPQSDIRHPKLKEPPENQAARNLKYRISVTSHVPEKFGGRFSKKAATPSLKSGDWPDSICDSCSTASWAL